jgi:hypothetical protein
MRFRKGHFRLTRRIRRAVDQTLTTRMTILTFTLAAIAALAWLTGNHDLLATGGPFLFLMAVPPHSGSGSMDLGPSGTFVKREDISELLFNSLYQENTLLGLLPIGEDFVDPELRWTEDSLNIFQVTDNTAGGQNATDATSTLQLSAGQGASIQVGTVVEDEGQTYITTGRELAQVINIVGDIATVTRGFAATTKATHAALATWRLIGPLLPENSDLDKDISQVRPAFSNVISRFGLSVNLSDEQLQRALAGYAPGVPNELDYQLVQRLREAKRQMDNALIHSRRTPAAGTTPGDYSAMQGLLAWLLTEVVDQLAVAFTPNMVNTSYANVFGQGGDPDWLVCGTTTAREIANLYADRIRIEQSERTRGWAVTMFDTDLHKTLRIVLDAFMPAGVFALLDSRRCAIRPYINSFLYYRTAESFRDGEAARVLSKWSLEVRNAKGTANSGSGFAHQMTIRAT